VDGNHFSHIQKLRINSGSLDVRDFNISTKNGVNRKAVHTRFYADHFFEPTVENNPNGGRVNDFPPSENQSRVKANQNGTFFTWCRSSRVAFECNHRNPLRQMTVGGSNNSGSRPSRDFPNYWNQEMTLFWFE